MDEIKCGYVFAEEKTDASYPGYIKSFGNVRVGAGTSFWRSDDFTEETKTHIEMHFSPLFPVKILAMSNHLEIDLDGNETDDLVDALRFMANVLEKEASRNFIVHDIENKAHRNDAYYNTHFEEYLSGRGFYDSKGKFHKNEPDGDW